MYLVNGPVKLVNLTDLSPLSPFFSAAFFIANVVVVVRKDDGRRLPDSHGIFDGVLVWRRNQVFTRKRHKLS